MNSVRGSCLCGDVSWSATGTSSMMTHCHCSMCRKTHGAAFGTYLGTEESGFRLERGADAIVHHESSPGTVRPFCGRCGSVAPYAPRHGRVFFAAGCLDDDPGIRPTAHIFVKSKAPWHEIRDDLRTFDGYPPQWDAPSIEPRARVLSDSATIRGSCLCTLVLWEIEAPLDVITNCHCRRCRKARSAAHASNSFCAPDRFRWTQGAEAVVHYRVPEAERFAAAFCRVCGSKVPRVSEARVTIPAGSLDGDPLARPGRHIFVAFKAPWFEITDDLPRFEGYPPS